MQQNAQVNWLLCALSTWLFKQILNNIQRIYYPLPDFHWLSLKENSKRTAIWKCTISWLLTGCWTCPFAKTNNHKSSDFSATKWTSSEDHFFSWKKIKACRCGKKHKEAQGKCWRATQQVSPIITWSVDSCNQFVVFNTMLTFWCSVLQLILGVYDNERVKICSYDVIFQTGIAACTPTCL